MGAPLLQMEALSLDTPQGRPLVRDLSLSLGRERVAVIGRNGVGKSTLLRTMAGQGVAAGGTRVSRGEQLLVPQALDADRVRAAARRLAARAALDPGFARALAREASEAGLGEPQVADAGRSRGEARKLLLVDAKLSGADLLLLDEPTEDLDEAGLAWLCRWLPRWEGGAVVVSHHRGLLRAFEHFFVVAESGCRYLPGPFDALLNTLQAEQRERQRKYLGELNHLVQREEHYERVNRRRARKKQLGRVRELRRCNSRARTNQNRAYAQVSQAREARIRTARIEGVRAWARATRRALEVRLSLDLRGPTLAPARGEDTLRLHGVTLVREGRTLVRGLDLAIERQRVALIGPNGAGKTTLMEVLRSERSPTAGRVEARAARIGAIAQGATDWELDASLVECLHARTPEASLEAVATRVAEHRFPLALARRPLRSLSPGERVRAALICLFAQAPQVELLLLDEPTYSLDFVGIDALQRALRAWPGGLVVASHDREFLDALGLDREIALEAAP